MTFEKTINEDDEITIDVGALFHRLIENWRIIIASMLVCALIGVIISAVSYVPSYTSTISYVINAGSTVSTTRYITESEFVVAEYLANTYTYVLNSTSLTQKVQAETGIDEDITQYISTKLIDQSNIMEVRVKTPDAQMSFNIAQAIYVYLPELSLAAVKTGSLDVIETPQLALKPDQNNGLQRMGVYGALIGFILSAALLIMIGLMRKPVTNPEMLSSKIDITHVGSIPHVNINIKKSLLTGKPKDVKHEPILITNKKTGFAFSETYKTLRTKIERSVKKHGYKTILITSTLENEGKSTVAANIALTLAQNKNKVIIVDCDLRNPSTAKILGIKDRVDTQVADVIEGKAPLESAVIRLPNLNLDIMGGKNSVENSTEMLSESSLPRILDTLKQSYDYIIVDTPPSSLFADAFVIAEYIDASLLVVRQGSAGLDHVINVVGDLAQANENVIGFVFNNVSDGSLFSLNRKNKYGYSYYRYGNYGSKS
ncbi:MAG: polysaccharide biosynthesis tyrosine autokinase [Clostridia bacterium]|nr:polysaccharide biosynthesis tyrosine autokinase [Clostridia bacterium]